MNEWEENFKDERDATAQALKKTEDIQTKTELTKKIQELSKKISKCAFTADELSTKPDNWIIDNKVINKEYAFWFILWVWRS